MRVGNRFPRLRPQIGPGASSYRTHTTRSLTLSYVIAPDGLIARVNGPWAKVKLSFLGEYGPVALKATMRKATRVYVDLFAGPGLNSLTGTGAGQIIEGSPLRAIELRTADATPL